MPLNEEESSLLEAFKTMLTTEDGLGLSNHSSKLKILGDTERGLEYLHNQIDQLFHQKSAELSHHTGICAAFTKIHSYKYLDDPTFEAAMAKEMMAQGIPIEEREAALEIIPKIIDELSVENERWSEQNAGWVDVKAMEDVSDPGD